MSSCSILRDPDSGEVVATLAPNGEPSILYQEALLAFNEDPNKALEVWAAAYTPEFMQRYGDWQNGQSSITLDANGEPVSELVFYSTKDLYNIIRERYPRYKMVSNGSMPIEKAQRLKARLEKLIPGSVFDVVTYYSEPGYARVVAQPSIKSMAMKYTKNEIRQQKEVINRMLDKLMPKFEGLSYEWITPSKLDQSEHYVPVDKVRAFVRNNKIYLVEGRVTPQEAMEEVAHVFVEMLRQNRPELFKGLFDAMREDPRFATDYVNIYNFVKNNRRIPMEHERRITMSEFIARNLGIALKTEMDMNPEGRPTSALGKLIARFLDWLSQLLNNANVSGKTTLEEISAYLNTEGVVMEVPTEPYKYYSTDDMKPTFDPDDRDITDNLGKEEVKRKTANELNIERAKEGIEKLKQMRKLILTTKVTEPNSGGVKQLATLDNLIKLAEYTLEQLESGRQTVSISKYKGSEDMLSLNTLATEMGAKFGTFYHELIEAVQNEYMVNKKQPLILYNQEWFDAFLKKHQDLILFDSYDKEMLYNMGLEIVSAMNYEIFNGNVILPEITIAAEDVHGQLVLGRLDIMSVNKKGEIKVIDLKTKKAKQIIKGQFPFNAFTVNHPNTQGWKDGVSVFFSGITSRSSFDNYQMQLDLYAEMLRKMGFEVSGMEVIALAYSMAPTNPKEAENKATSWKLVNYGVRIYDDIHFLDRADGTGVTMDDKARIIREAAMYAFGRKAVEPELVEEEKKVNPFALMTPEAQSSLIDSLIKLSEEQLNNVNKEISDLDKDINMDKDEKNKKKVALEKRKSQLESAANSLKSNFIGETDEALAKARALVIKTAVDVFAREVDTIAGMLQAINLPQTYVPGSESNKTAMTQLYDHIQALDAIGTYLDAMRTTVINMPVGMNPEVQESLTAYFDKKISQIATQIAIANKFNKKVVIAIIRDQIGEERWMKVFGDVKKVLGPKLAWLNKTIEEIETGKTTNNTFSYKAMRKLASIFKGIENKQDRLESLKQERTKIEKLMNMDTISDTLIEEYLDGILDSENSQFFMGQTMIGGDYNVVQMSDLIGSNADSELIISSMFQYMRNIAEKARVEALRWADELNIDKLKNDFISSMGGIENANKMLTEEVEVALEFDDQGEVTKKTVNRKYADPVSMVFYNTYDKYRSKLRKQSLAIRNLNVQIRDTVDTVIEAELKKQRKELIAENEATAKDFVEWQIEKSNTRVKPEVLRLMHGSGYANELLTDLYEKIQGIVSRAGGEENLTEQDQDVIDALHADVSRIRTETLEQDPNMKERMDKLSEFFEYDPNYLLWSKKRQSIAQEGTAAQLASWDRNNTDEIPTEEYNNAIENLYDQRNAILGDTDSVLQDLFARRAKIKAKAKVRGKFNFNYLNEEDINEYNEIEQQISERYEQIQDLEERAPEEIAALRMISDRLKSLREQVRDPRYVKKINQLREEVRKEYDNLMALEKKYEQTKDNNVLAQVKESRDQYFRKEMAFANYWNTHNKNKYTPGQDLIVQSKEPKEKLNSYMYVYMPRDKNHIEKAPNNRYRIKRLKSEAYNPNYQNSFQPIAGSKNFYPMPKGISFNSDTNEFEISSNAEFVNPKYMEIHNNPVAKEFYKKWIIEQFLIKQREASGQPLGFYLPFVQQLGLENVLAKGMQGVAREYQEKLQEVTYQSSDLEKATNESGMSGQQRILFKENYLPKENHAMLTTTDGIGAIVNWNGGFYANKKLAMLGLEMTGVLSFLKGLQGQLTKKPNESKWLDTIINQIEYNKDKFVFGQVFKKGTEEGSLFNRKTLRLLMGVASFGRMAFDIPMQFGNLLSGNVQAFLSTSDLRKATTQNYLNAKKMVYTRWMPRLLADWGTVSGASFETKLFRFMNPLSKDLNRMYDANTVKKMRRLANRVFNFTDLSMALQDKGEVEIGLTTMLMILDNKKYQVFETDPDGNILLDEMGQKKVKKNPDGSVVFVNGVDAFGLDESNSIAPKKNVNISEAEISQLKSEIMGEMYRFQGNYATYTKSRFGSTMIGSLYEFYRKYLIPAVDVRFRPGGYQGVGSMYSWDTSEAYMGWYMAMGKMFKYYGWQKAAKTLLYDTLLPGFVKNKLNADTGIQVGDYYRHRSAMAAREMMFALLFYMLYQTLRSSLYDGDEDDFNYLELSMMRSLVKVSNESRSMVPLIIVGKPADYIDNFSSLTSVLREFKIVWDLGANAFWFADFHATGSDYAFERGFYQKDTPRFEEGDAKVLKNLNDITGWSNVVDVFDPYEAAKANLKQK